MKKWEKIKISKNMETKLRAGRQNLKSGTTIGDGKNSGTALFFVDIVANLPIDIRSDPSNDCRFEILTFRSIRF